MAGMEGDNFRCARHIRALNYLDNGNLNRLDDGPGRGKQQQLINPVTHHIVTH